MSSSSSSTLPPATINFPAEEEVVLELWKKLDAFQTCLKQSQGRPRFSFYDGPPFATGLPHYGHILAGTIKDIIPRWMHQHGFHVERRFGWDTHGLPVEHEIDKTLNIKGPADVAKMGIDKYNAECRKIVMRYAGEWEATVNRLGRWIDFKNDYKTLYPWFMETIWWVFKQLYEKGLIYQGFRVMPYSTGCCTPIANFEATQNYKDVIDPAVTVSFPLDEDPNVSMIAWTTTPWTLPSNMALCVNPEMDYVKIKDNKAGKIYIMLKARIVLLFSSEEDYAILDTFKGSSLKDKTYQPIFNYFEKYKQSGAFRVLCDSYVTDESGTGIVHQAPYFGEDDNRVCLAAGVITRDQEIVCPLDATGKFVLPVTDFEGQYVKDADKNIIKKLKDLGRLVHAGQSKHSYPFCWRSDTPLLYRAVPSWFMRVQQMQDLLLERNSETYWVPESIKEGRFGNWLRDARDWNLSRNRYWGTPIPVWMSEDGEESVCIGSIEELERLSGHKITDLHRESVDHITIPSARPGQPPLKRISEVFDCWFESGSMPYAQAHYPFEHKKEFEESFPADFIAEGTDQTRGWFYTLLVLSTALFNKPPFKNVIVNGLVLASDGQKMSKSKKNYPNPNEVLNKYGADALRLYLINSPVVKAESLRFKEDGVRDILKDVFLPWYNAYRFLLQNVGTYQASNAGARFAWSEASYGKSSNVMDRWIISFSQSLLVYVKKEMAAYRLYTVLPQLMKFIDNLTNWYVRTNRKRLKGEGNTSEDCLAALQTLFSVLFTMVRVFAPFTPFLTESMYQRLRHLVEGFSDKEETASVHFLMIPQPRHDLIDVGIERSVARMQTVIELARVVRDRKTMPVKYPLPELVLIHKDQQCLDDVRTLQDYVLDELNVKKLTLSTNKQQYGVTLRAEPDHKTLGLRLKGAFKDVMKEIKELDDAKITQFLLTNKLEILGNEIQPEDLRIMYTFAGDDKSLSEKYEAHSDNDLLILVDCTPDQSMLDEGLSREIINRVQKLRKKANLLPSDDVTVFYELTPAKHDLARIIAEFQESIESTTKSPIRPLKDHKEKQLARESYELKGATLTLTVVEGFCCSDFQRSSASAAATSDGGSSSKNGTPPCKFVNVAFGDQMGVVLLENPVGANVISDVGRLREECENLFGQQELRVFLDREGREELLERSSLNRVAGKTLFACRKQGGGGKSSTKNVEEEGSCCCKFVQVESAAANGKVATLLLENPKHSNLVPYAQEALRRVYDLKDVHLFDDKGKDKKKVEHSDVGKFAGKCLYV